MTSLASMAGKMCSVLSSTSVTWAKPTGPRFSVPPKITSSIFLPRRLLTDCSPMTQQMASEMLDFPEPLGPTTAVMSSPKRRTVLSGKDLKPWISSARRVHKHTSFCRGISVSSAARRSYRPKNSDIAVYCITP